jgi:hypothetical protein
MDFRSFVIVLYLVGATACAHAAAPQDGAAASVSPVAPSPLEPGAFSIRLERVRVFIKDGRPQAYVEAPLGDSCNSLRRVDQHRSSNAISLTMTGNRTGGPCAYLMQYIKQWIALEGAFPSGAYTLRVNDMRVNFTILTGAAGELQIEPDPGPLPSDPPAAVVPGIVSPNDPPSNPRQPNVVPGSPGAPVGRAGAVDRS